MKFVRGLLVGLYINLFLIILSWFFLFMGMLDDDMGNWKQWTLLFALIISGLYNVVFGVLNIINTCKLFKNKDYNSLRKYLKVMKISAIPYFILNFILYILLFVLFFFASRGILIFTPIPLLFIIPIFCTYLSLIFTSSYGIGFLVILYKYKKVKIGNLVIHILLQLCFIFDVVDTLVLLKKYKIENVIEVPNN